VIKWHKGSMYSQQVAEHGRIAKHMDQYTMKTNVPLSIISAPPPSNPTLDPHHRILHSSSSGATASSPNPDSSPHNPVSSLPSVSCPPNGTVLRPRYVPSVRSPFLWVADTGRIGCSSIRAGVVLREGSWGKRRKETWL